MQIIYQDYNSIMNDIVKAIITLKPTNNIEFGWLNMI